MFMSTLSPFRRGLIGLATLGILGTAAHAHNCVGEMHYMAQGKLQVELGANFERKTGISLEPMADIQVRLRRDDRPGSELTSNVVITDADGTYTAHGCFARDTNGILSGGRPIEITIQARLKSGDLKLRDANIIDSDWHTVGRYTDRDGGTRDVGVRTYNRAGNAIASEYDAQAQIWWLYSRELARFEQRGVGIPGRLSVTFPHASPFRDPETAHAIGKDIFLGTDDGPGDADEPLVMIHELMHAWHVSHLNGDVVSGCLVDAHHKPASHWTSSRCSGFSEGFAQAGARWLMDRHYDTPESPPVSAAQMRNPGEFFPGTPLRSLDDVERTDVGWENVFRYFFAEDEWGPNGLVPRFPGCTAKDVKLFQVMRALEAENFSLPSATVREVLRILERQIDGFERRDADIYEMVVDPANRDIAAMQARLDNEFCAFQQIGRGDVNSGLNPVRFGDGISTIVR